MNNMNVSKKKELKVKHTEFYSSKYEVSRFSYGVLYVLKQEEIEKRKKPFEQKNLYNMFF